MKLTGLRLQNITCFEDVTLDFTDPRTGKPSPWIVLLGENGTGKSTILQMISVALLGSEQLSVIAGDIDWRAYVRYAGGRTDEGSVQLSVLPQDHDIPFYAGTVQQIFIELYEDTARRGNGIIYRDSVFNHSNPGEEKGWFACSYSPWRRIAGRQKSSEASSFPIIGEENKAFRFGTMFGDERGLTPTTDWIADLFFATLHPDKTPNDEKRLESAIDALEKALPNVKFDYVTRNREIRFREAGLSVPLERLSDGYRSTAVWTIDLVRRLWEAFPDSDNPLKESGVVLIDEIDLHLHPRWQREIVERTRRLFPNLQFIVATHSPFVAQDMRKQDQIIVLKRKRAGQRRSVIVEQEKGFVKGWRVDQILTSFLFGLNGTRNQSVLVAEREYERLMEEEAAGEITKPRRERLNTLRRRLDRVRSSPGEFGDERDLYQIADDVIQALTRDSSRSINIATNEDEE